MSSPSGGAVQEIEEAFAEAGISGLPASCYDQFSAYLGLLLRWNARLNLTAIREPGQIIRRHFVECAFAAQHLPVDIESLLDYGSGAAAGNPVRNLPSRDPRNFGRGTGKEGILPTGSGTDGRNRN